MMTRRLLGLVLVFGGSLIVAPPATAELVFLTSGRTLSVKSVRTDGPQAVLALRSGGELVCDRALIARIEPDEVPYPEPAPVEPALPEAEARTEDAPQSPAAYDALITQLSKRHGVDKRLVHAVVRVESAYQPRARSRKGARGLMQLMPATARQYGVVDSYHPVSNLDAGIRHLRSLLDRFELRLALAAYNAGEAAVQRFGGVPPYRETRDYVARVMALARR
jgi:soluble lytic murein transglycosylase-like protein